MHFFRRGKLLRNNPESSLRAGFPRFKSKHRGLRSLTTSSFTLHRSGRRFSVNIKGLGKFTVKHAPPKEDIKFVRIVRTPLRVVVQFCFSKMIDVRQQAGEPVGIDLGVSKQAVLSTGESLPRRTPDIRRTRRLQRKLSKAVRHSRNRTKKRLACAKERARISEREKQAMHRLTSELVKRHKHFVVEDLAVGNMTRSAKGDAENPGRHVALQVGVEQINPRTGLGLLRPIAHLQFDQCRWLGGTGGTAQHVEALFKVWLEASGPHPKDQDL